MLTLNYYFFTLEEASSPFQVEAEKLKEVLASVISMYEEELKCSKQISNSDLQNEIGVQLEISNNLLSDFDSEASPDKIVLKNTIGVCTSTIDLVR